MRSQKFVAYTATCLAVLGGLALAKPATVHAADVQTSVKANDNSVNLKQEVGPNTKAILHDYRGQAKNVVDNEVELAQNQKAEAAAKDAYFNATGDAVDHAKSVYDSAKQAADSSATSLKVSQDAVQKIKKDHNIGDVTANTVASDKAALDAAYSKLSSAKADYTKSLADFTAFENQKFGKDWKTKDNALEGAQKGQLWTAVENYGKAYYAVKNGKGTEVAVQEAGLKVNQLLTDNPYKQAELSSADLHQLGELYAKQYSDYLNTKDNSDLVKKFNDLYAKYAIDLGVYNIDNYMVAYKNDKVAKQAADAAKKAYDDAASQGKDTVALYTAYRQAADSYAKSHADFVKNVATPFTNYSKYTDATPDADKGAGAWTPANAVVKEATTPVTPNQPNQQPTTPVAPSDTTTLTTTPKLKLCTFHTQNTQLGRLLL